MVTGYASPSSSSPPTPRSPLPVSVGPTHHHYYFSSSPSPPFSPPSSPHPDILVTPFSLHHQLQLQPHHHYHRCSCLLHLLRWFLHRCCTSFSTRKRLAT
ncbi:hypothetical protein RDI58_009568 [Solanum bulbocastanum]|uniref:Uncharacterized protein n=1 Tax=Solanum bulbocastanum TaxID=147425 RepID=A0AAN8TWW8_SOLBU